MTRRLLLLLSLFAGAATVSFAQAAAPRAAVLLVDLRAAPAAPLLEERRDILDTPMAPGSIAKVFALLAALDAGTITPASTMSCPRRLTLEGRAYRCSHPDPGRPLTPAEALAESCNTYFASVASRLPRAALDRAFVRAGLRPPAASAPTVEAALGLDGVRVTPRELLAAFARVTAGGGPSDPRHHRVLIEGLRGAAQHGTARALGDAGIAALAKTGTSAHAGMRVGLVVAVLPPERPTHAIVVVAPGAAGLDAAAIAADRLRDHPGIAAGAKRPDGDGANAGPLRIGRVGGATSGVETVALETYVAGVVAAEAPSSAPPEALKALAIVARTFAIVNRGRHRDEGFDLCGLTHCQVLGQPGAASRAAARATDGQVLTHRGRPAPVFYSASCGGHSERPSAVWPGATDPPYLVSRPEPACRLEPEWISDVSAAQVAVAMRAAGLRGEVVRSLRVSARTPSGRAAALEAGGFDPAVVPAEVFRVALGRTAGWRLLRSTAFDVERRAGGYRFRGRGRGHGVGLCVEGAMRLAREGRVAAEILTHYFPGAGLSTPAASRGTGVAVEVVVPRGEEGRRKPIRALASEAVLAIARAAETRVPPSARLVFHPTVAAYTRATGLPWWTSGATRGTTIDLLPPSALRRRGILERTVRHELAHVVIGDRLAGRPLWVQEGAAMFLAGEVGRTGRGARLDLDGRGCPSDHELSRASSADALRQAYALAAACFERDLRGGRRWDEVGRVSTTGR